MTKSSARGTHHIGVRPLTNLFHAARYSKETGRALTLAVTINWDRLGIAEDAAMDHFRDLRRRTRRRWAYLVQTGMPLGSFDDLATQENPGGKRNTHWALHVPPHILEEIKQTIEKRLMRITKVDDLEKALMFQPIHPQGLGGHIKYMGKGVRPDFANYFHVRAVDQGFVSGHGRTLVSRSLGFKARKENGWNRKRPNLLRGKEPLTPS